MEVFFCKPYSEITRSTLRVEADILSYAFLIAGKYNFNIPEIMMDKIKKNNNRYPVDKSRGNAKKYNDLN